MVHHERYAANITKLEDEQINNLEPKVQVEKPPDLAASYGLKVWKEKRAKKRILRKS